uniref:Uncharacterized protein n=1 Tax=Avena sativa TaxID=4498 RepID=A0ACD5TAY9_AVESA
MEAALVSAATGVLKHVLGKLGTLLGDKYKCFKEVRKDIKYLAYELTAMDAFLMKMSEEEDPDVQDKVWMNEVRELSYDMEDYIDDFMQSVGEKDTKPEGFMENIKHSLGKWGEIRARRRIGHEVHDLKKQITEHASELVGIDKPKAELIRILTQEDGRASVQQHLKLVSIVGLGGMGKTTLANQVYQHFKGEFECRAFLSVSRNPDMMNIIRIILSEISGQDYAATEAGSTQQLIRKITYFLANKRYFVVVDDIWDVDTWGVIKLAFPMTSSGSVIITTTRINDVAESCRSSFSGKIYSIRPLDIVHSRQLFYRRLFQYDEDCPSHLEKVSNEILKKCDGLPLAIIAISGLLANRERTIDIWNQVKNSVGRALERNASVERMMRIVSLSYFDLPPHLRTCLLYLSTFPEDCIIKKECLIRRWVGEGFVRKEGRYTAHDIGEIYFNELINRGLIQPGEKDVYGNVNSCRAHDTVLDFIISKSIEENFVTLLDVHLPSIGTQSKVVRRLSLQVGKKGKSTIPTSGMLLSHIRSLHVFGDSMEIPSLEEFRHLRVLDLKDCLQLEGHHLENIVRLFQLRYLNLKNTGIRKLPEQTGRLGCLEMMHIRDTYVRELPASIVDLRKLSHLFVDEIVKFPDGIAKMQALESLELVDVSIQPLDFLWGLVGKLNNLRNLNLLHCEVDGVTNRDTYMAQEESNKAIISSLCKLSTHNLRSLTIMKGSNLLQEPLCMLTLEKLIIMYSPVPRVPKWVSSLMNLQQIHLEVELVEQDDLYILGALPSLLILHLKGQTKSNGRLRICGETGFQFLRIFIYDTNYGLLDLKFAAGSMRKLEKIEIVYLCIVEANSLDFGIENLPCLITIGCIVRMGEVDIIEAGKAVIERAVNTHPNQPTLLFQNH